jgi:hypothetical protein
MWKIIDNDGVIYSGTEIEMTRIFDIITNPTIYNKSTIKEYQTSWNGDLLLIQVHNIYR